MAKQKDIFITTEKLTKYFGTNKVVDEVNIEVRHGEILGLIGENGSGKSTILSMISGIYDITEGEIFVHGKKYKPQSTLDAQKEKIHMLVQEIGTVTHMTIAENIFLGHEDEIKQYGLVSQKLMHEKTKTVLDLVELGHLSPETAMYQLNSETRKLIELATAMYRNPELLIVDETTTALSHEGRAVLFGKMRELIHHHKTVMFVSHDLNELMAVCDRIIVLRDGVYVKAFDHKDFDESAIKQAMVGRVIEGNFYRNDYEVFKPKEKAIEVKNVSTDTLKDIDFTLYKGEVLGIGGLSQSGMHDIGKLLFGAIKPSNGEVYIYDQPLKNIPDAIKHKVGYISKNRDEESINLDATIKDNLVIASLNKLLDFNFYIRNKKVNELAQEQMETLDVKARSINQYVKELSGGNKQKVAFAKWLANDSKILILDNPTRGIDVGVKTTMYQMIDAFRKQDYAIVIISEELSEIIGMSDRILMMKDGSINHEFLRSKTLSEQDLIEYMI